MKPLVIAGLIVILGFALSRADAEVIYREVFPNDTDGNKAPESWAGWHTYSGDGTEHDSGDGRVRIDHVAGKPQNLPAIHSNPGSSEQAKGLYNNFDTIPETPVDYLTWTDEYVIDRSSQTIQAFRWFQGNAQANDVDRLAIRIDANDTPSDPSDDTWFVTSQGFTQTSGISTTGAFDDADPDGAQEQTFMFNTQASTWRSLDFVAGSSLSLGDVLTSDLPSGNITAFGLYTDTMNGTLRFDTFEVSTVPEPGALSLLGLGGLALLRRKRRHRNDQYTSHHARR